MPIATVARSLSPRRLATAVAVVMSGYHLYTGYFGAPIAEVHYPAHLLLALTILFLLDEHAGLDGWRRRLARAYDAFVILLTLLASGYLFVNAEAITQRMLLVTPLTPAQLVLGACLIFVILDAARRTVGWALVAIATTFLLYAYLGHFLPDPLWHRGYTLNDIIEYSYLTTEGIFGVPVAVMASYVFHFVLFGALLVASGAGDFFTDFARALTGRATGGPAKTAVVSSTFMGMLSGSSAANVVTTGSFTIPAMRRCGYPPTFAAGVEAVASAGGQLTPPIMGAAAFIMMEFAGVSYTTIMGIAIIPAVLYFLAVFFMVDLEARRLGLGGSDEELPRLLGVLRRRGYLLLAIFAMVYLLIQGWTPTMAAVSAIGTLVGLLVLFDAENRRRILGVALEAMAQAPKLVGPVTVACAVGGLLVGLIGLTGFGLRMSSIILEFSGGYLLLILIFTMIMGVILGMGMPTSGAYVILAALLAPGLVEAGVELLAAHMFIMYSAAKSSITPPVAIASYAAAAVAGTDPWRTSLVAFRLGLSVFIIPFMFVYGPALLGLASPLEVSGAVITAIAGVLSLSVACIGWLMIDLRWYERLAALAGALFLIQPNWLTDGIGFVVFGATVLLAGLRARRASTGALAPIHKAKG